MVTFGWIASAFHTSQRRPKIVVIHNFNHRLGEAHRAAAIQGSVTRSVGVNEMNPNLTHFMSRKDASEKARCNQLNQHCSHGEAQRAVVASRPVEDNPSTLIVCIA